ncbi:polysaccharide deacetylase family protein [Aneurinibacillus sp. Ricciae_BoGa-3]|uniref:polysaccharide deacetylase family protein n=1 Tax=Aneurinibacillus sp. Ricciae_BoGa-3 TaxID=3022697 RepID=UPI00233F8760|nr:polysaccharide deacetylase family protein [Aneurinibacillus sp. Ricciae_BoGa-3]WCK56034.1 polysaccharide deacetylase family protein [Aneurinibacillus sp. Ricciae_BoGa-3]
MFKKVMILFLLTLLVIPHYAAAGQPATHVSTRSVPVLLYHHLLTRREKNKAYKYNDAVITTEMFVSQMKLLHDNGYKTLTLNELERFVRGEESIPDKSVVITFDDGYLSNFKYAYPILRAYHYKAAIFAITGNIRRSPEVFTADGLNFISWQELQAHADVFQYEGHTGYLHRKDGGRSCLLSRVPEDVLADLAESKQMLGCRYFAYPYGEYDRRLAKLVQKAGYKMAFTTYQAKVEQGMPLYELPRYGIDPSTSTRSFKNMVGIR